MKRTKKILVVLLGTLMLFGATATASAASYPYNIGCPHCSYPNSAERQSTVAQGTCWCGQPKVLYRCGHCSMHLYGCTQGHATK